MTPAALAQWRQDAALMREFARSPEWATLRRHLEALRDDALAQEDRQPPTNADEVMHYRAARLAFGHALRLPDVIVTEAARADEMQKVEAARVRALPQRGSKR